MRMSRFIVALVIMALGEAASSVSRVAHADQKFQSADFSLTQQQCCGVERKRSTRFPLAPSAMATVHDHRRGLEAVPCAL
jgi:hypothetical protein